MEKLLVFATNNAHKLEEVRAILAEKFAIRSLAEIGCEADIPETGVTFEENASLKSHYVLEHFGLPCFGDDSGLEIDALDGAPGVYSARYSGSREPAKNIDLVLQQMTGKTDRAARFRTVISLVKDGGEHFFEGTISGTIRNGRSGTAGFGYDPIFQPDGYTKTFAEMTAGEKNAISHRAIAIQKLVLFLKQEA
ncbi:RdgB/HAM1 family non-canonical purine NTP pyrophosphatase [Hufsiella ginkgonis]|nr:RdgB/HAM1 family non-canonical purine NTP pyrophosphatase [Hufsiella ginkgonis]